MKIFILYEGLEYGPYDKGEIFVQLRDGTLRMDSSARQDGETEWRPLGEVLNSRSSALLSLEQIEKVQAENTVAPTIIPTAAHSTYEYTPPAESEAGSRLWLAGAGLVAGVVIGVSCLLFTRSGPAVVPVANTQQSAPTNPILAVPTGSNKAGKVARTSAHSMGDQGGKSTESTLVSGGAAEAYGAGKSLVPNPVAAPEAGKSASGVVANDGHPAVAPIAGLFVPATSATSVPEVTFRPDFFKIELVKYNEQVPHDGIGPWERMPGISSPVYQPCLEAYFSTQADIDSSGTFAKAYFFDGKKLLAIQDPSPVGTESGPLNAVPAVLHKEKSAHYFFEIPPEIRKENWMAVIVFGNGKVARSACYPPAEDDSLVDYPEKLLVHDPAAAARQKIANKGSGNNEVKAMRPRPVKRSPMLAAILAKPSPIPKPDSEVFLSQVFAASTFKVLRPGGRNAGIFALPPKPKVIAVVRPPAAPTGPKIFVTSDFFRIQSVNYIKQLPADGVGPWEPVPHTRTSIYQPSLEVKVSTGDNTLATTTMAKAYFFEGNKLLASEQAPTLAGTIYGHKTGMPVLFYKQQVTRMFFEVPAQIRNRNWMAVVVFGDGSMAKSACYPPSASDFLVDYPEKTVVYNHAAVAQQRRAAIDPLIQYVVKTRNPSVPQITLFMRMPVGISDPSQLKGVMAISMLAGNVEFIRDELKKQEMDGDYNGLLAYANEHKLAIVAWCTHGFWKAGTNNEDLAKDEAKKLDENFDTVANGWEQGIKDLGAKYGLPQKDFLLWGNCGAAQFAHRLLLRKPNYFLAIAFHIPGSFDKPTPEASKVLWCLTTGELYGGYENSLKFVAECRALGYPMIYKAFIGMGHSSSPDVQLLCFKFFDLALKIKELREIDAAKAGTMTALLKKGASAEDVMPEAFKNPPYYGDMINQVVYPAKEVSMIPAGFRVPLPNKDIADIWARD